MARNDGLFIRLSPAAKAWIEETAASSGLLKHQVIERLVENARNDPSAFYAHASAVQSWAAATMSEMILRRVFGEADADHVLAHIAAAANGLFAADPPAPRGVVEAVETGERLRRILGQVLERRSRQDGASEE